ncbi:Arginine--tRNA ligase, partial [Frankliniella fusca]
ETAEVKGAIAWLAHSRSPWPTVLQKWRVAAPTRFRILFHEDKKYVNDYIEEFPVLGHCSGHELLLQDFDLMYPSAKSLYAKWESFATKTLSFAKRQIKDKTCKDMLKLTDKQQINQNGVASVILNILPALKSNTYAQIRGTSVKVGIDLARDSYLVKV